MEALSSYKNHARKVAFSVAIAVVLLSCLRLAHVHLLWADEDYHLAAAINFLHGRVPYRDFWYDKPPLTAAYYLLEGGWFGYPLRLLDALYIVASSFVAYRFASSWWSKTEGYIAALLLSFFTAFYLPSAVIPFAADAVMLLPHLLAVYFAFRRRPWLAGGFAGLAFLANIKGILVAASCVLFLLPQIFWLLASFLVTTGLGMAALVAMGAWAGYIEQVWRWGLVYAKDSPVLHPLANGTARTLNWMGFHLFPVLGTGYSIAQAPFRDRWKLGGWVALSFVAVSLGGRFAPHYFLQLLPPLVIAGSRGAVLGFHRYGRRMAAVGLVLLAVPLVRFGPRYLSLAFDSQPLRWADVAMDLDSRAVAQQINTVAKSGDTLFVWGYRPDVYVYTRMTSDSRFWDSQPLTGVPADRHLSASTPIYGGPAEKNRAQLAASRPTWVVDGLGLLNPKLRLDGYLDLRPWLTHYALVGRTSLSLIYKRKE